MFTINFNPVAPPAKNSACLILKQQPVVSNFKFANHRTLFLILFLLKGAAVSGERSISYTNFGF
jgi:hypothetical protein